MPRIRALLRNLFRTRRVEADLDDEVRVYVEIIAAEKMARGVSAAEAMRQARIEAGGVEQVKESVREARMGATLAVIGRDLRQAFRSFRRSPGFVLASALTLALGVGANAAIFSIVDAVLIRGLPYGDSGRLVSIAERIPRQNRISFSPREFLDLERSVPSLEAVGGATGNPFTVAWRGGEPRICFGQIVTTGLLPALGVAPRRGRLFLDEEGLPGRDHVVILSDELWRDVFAGDPLVVGETVSLNNEPYRVVGIMPPGFEYPEIRYKLWVPAALAGGLFQKFPDAHLLRVVGRIRRGAARSALDRDLAAFDLHLAQIDPDGRRHAYAVDLATSVVGDYRRPLALLMCAVGALLLIACANVANLALARATSRAREFSVRAAIGATRGRLIAQVLTESLLLSLFGGAAGLLAGMWGVRSLAHWNPGSIPLIEATRLDWRVMAFTLAVCALASCVFGLGPALSIGNSNLVDFVRQSGRGIVGVGGRRLRRSLVFAQVALATMLLIGAGVMIRSLMALESVPAGIRPAGVLTAGVVMQEQAYPAAPQMLAFYRRLMQEARAMPGVQDVAIATHLPFTGQGWGNGFSIEGRPASPGEQLVAQIRPVSPHYFSTLAIPLERGRLFADTDVAGAAPVAIVNSTFARRYWPDGDATGKRLDLDGAVRTIIGVVADVKPGRLDAAPDPEIYFPYEQFSNNMLTFLGRGITIVARSTSGNAEAIAPALRAAVRNADRTMGLRDVRSMSDLIGVTLAQPRFRALLFGLFSALALALAAVGIYGVMSYSITQRTGEFGVRIALGASAGEILGMVVRDGAAVALSGVAAGVAGALAVGRAIATLLFEVKPNDPVTIIAVAALLAAVAVVASLLPALRVTRLDATTALRGE